MYCYMGFRETASSLCWAPPFLGAAPKSKSLVPGSSALYRDPLAEEVVQNARMTGRYAASFHQRTRPRARFPKLPNDRTQNRIPRPAGSWGRGKGSDNHDRPHSRFAKGPSRQSWSGRRFCYPIHCRSFPLRGL